MRQVWIVGLVVAVLGAGCGGSDTGGGWDDGGPDDGAVTGDGGIHQQDGAGGQVDGPLAQHDAGSQQHDAATPQQDAAASCIPGTANGPSGMNAGTACLSCHAFLTGTRHFTLGGTLYTNVNGSARVGGATIQVTDATNKVITMITGSDGNFWSGQSVTFPIRGFASKCPDSAAMSASQTSGDCNKGGCHSSGNRMHLP